MENNEVLPVVDPDGNVIRAALREECHNGSKLLHPVVHLHVIDASGNLLLQKRSMNKRIQPGKWDTAVGGHVDFGESIGEALQRESSEEIGFPADSLKDAELVDRYVFESAIERELVACNIVVAPVDFAPRAEPGEADEVRYWPLDEIKSAIGSGVLTPNFEAEFIERVYPYLRKRYGFE